MHLYHYTGVKSLISIIESNCFRFTRADLLEDPFDSNFPHVNLSFSNGYKNSIYVACFTVEEKEQDYLWETYNNFEGVRFKISSNLFGQSINTEIEYNRNNNPEINIEICPFGNASSDEIKTYQCEKITGPININYLAGNQSEDLISVSKSKKTNYKIMFKQLIFSKLESYGFEKEVRYAILPPIGKIFTDVESHRNNPNLNLDKPYISVNLQTKIDEVILGPKVNLLDENTIRLIKLLKKHNHKISIKLSEIK